MQRRAGKGTARIATPTQSTMPVDDEKSSRLSQRNFGVTNRIWLILSLLLFVVTFTHFISSSSSSSAYDPAWTNANLKSKNYLNSTVAAEGNPFDFCPVFGPGDELGRKYGQLVLSQSRIHLGSGARVQRMIHRALLGQPVTISVVGGSVSACHGAGDDPVSPNCYPSRFFRWWNTVFPHPASELTNGAMRRSNSAYFGFCNSHHIPDVTDLVILELDVDDLPDKEAMTNFELLVRSLLLRVDQPAVLVLGHFSPQSQDTYGYTGPDHWHTIVAQFYDIPHISIKPALYPKYINSPNSIKPYFVDPVLASPLGHQVLSDILQAYFQHMICNTWSAATGHSYDNSPMTNGKGKAAEEPHGLFGGVGQRPGVIPENPDPNDVDGDGSGDGERKPPTVKEQQAANLANPHLKVPPAMISTQPNEARPFQEIAPYCVSANDLINPLPPSLFYGSGWYGFHPTPGSPGAALNTAAHYWYSTLPTSKLRIPLQLGAGDVGIYYLKEPSSVVGEGSAVECWVDDNYSGARVLENLGTIGEATPVLEMIDHNVARGSHYVECQLLGQEGQGVPAFKIIGVFGS